MPLLWKRKSFKPLNISVNSFGGRNAIGKISINHRGGGTRKIIRLVDYHKYLFNVPGLVVRIEYNPYLNCLLAFICFSNGILNYILCPKGLSVGMIIKNGFSLGKKVIGNSYCLRELPVGTFVHNLEISKFCGGQFLRSTGSYGRIMSRDVLTTFIKLRSGKIARVDSNNTATVGVLSPLNFKKKVHHRAGFFRLRGWRPCVRGVAMNPVDHPHGGGEGKSGAGRPSVSRWGWLTKNVKKKT